VMRRFRSRFRFDIVPEVIATPHLPEVVGAQPKTD